MQPVGNLYVVEIILTVNLYHKYINFIKYCVVLVLLLRNSVLQKRVFVIEIYLIKVNRIIATLILHYWHSYLNFHCLEFYLLNTKLLKSSITISVKRPAVHIHTILHDVYKNPCEC